MTAGVPDFGGDVAVHRVPRAFVVAAALVVAFLISVVVRNVGSYYLPVDGWSVDLFEFAMGMLCIARYYEPSWRANQSVTRLFPLVLGVACISWSVGDFALTIESLNGATPSVPSVADGFYICFFPLAYISIMLLIRGGNRGSLVTTSLDGLIAGLGVASLAAAFLFAVVERATGGGALATATSMAYPSGDLLLLALVVGGLAVLPKEYRRFLAIVAVAMAANATGDLFNLLQPTSKIGYISNAIAWPISLLLLAIATWSLPANAGRTVSERSSGFTLPAIGAVASMFILFTASVWHVGRGAIIFATATLFVAAVRLTITVREGQALKTARFRSLVDKAWDIIVVAEADCGVAYITPSSERVLGYSPAELQGRSLTELVHPDDNETMVGHLASLGDGSSTTAVFETRMRHRNGAWRRISWNATDLLSDPSVRGYVLNGGDVTEAREAVEELAAARDGALSASKAKSQFVSMMSHEIRTPMNGVIGLTDLLLETTLDGDQLELASGIKVSAESLLVIVNDILDFSKIEAGKLDIEEAEFDVVEVVDDVGRILAGAAHNKGLELLVDVHSDVPAVLLGDGVRLQQVLLNLGSNAVKFTSEGEVVIRAAVLREDLERVALRFEVIDMGIGIALGDQERLFRAFAQADSSTTRKFGGTGLGLTISSQLVELMGGNLGVISAPGEGSTFWFEVSLRRADSPDGQEARSHSPNLAGRRALIVDDNATNRRILRQQLASWQVEAVEAVDGFEAIALATEAAAAGQPFDLGVIDLNMPGMDGIELAAMLKTDPGTTAMILFLLSSSGARLGAAESHLKGFAGSLIKPVRSSELFDCLITSVNGRPEGPAESSRSTDPAPNIEEIAGLILLVEDNQVNQLVGSKVLSKLGFAFDICNNGREAVSAAQVGRYDAILMDCQMPEMDGYEATAEIRRLEGSDRHTPIIAMTAAAMEGDRDTCLAAGMDDYITKPVRLETVSAVLERWVRDAGSDETPPNAGGSPSGDAPDFLDYSQIELLRSLDDGDGLVLNEIIDQYLTQAAHGRGELLRVVSQGDTSSLERAAHTIRGASANVGASALAAVCAEMEACARTAQLDDAAKLIEQFDAELARVREALSELASKD